MESLYLFFILIIIVMALLIMLNTYNVYRITKLDFAKQNLLDMQEFNDVHPMIKELYKEAIVNGVFYIQNLIVKDIIEMNDIDKWYNANKEDLLKLIKVIKQKGENKYESSEATLPPNILSKLNSLDIPELIDTIKDANDFQSVIENEDINNTTDFINDVINKKDEVKNKYSLSLS